MNITYKVFFVLLILSLSSACSIHHRVADDYGQYLLNNKGQATFEKIHRNAQYSMDEQTRNHKLEFRSAMVGYAHVWVVEFGRILEASLEAEDFQQAFDRLVAANANAPAESDMDLHFSLRNYTFEGFEATVSMNVKATSHGQTLVDKNYLAKGKSQGGKMFWAGAFGMKNAIQQSTKLAVDGILTELAADLKAAQ